MNKTVLAGLFATVLALNACTGGTPQGGSADNQNKSASATTNQAAASTPANDTDRIKLKSSDGKISIDSSGQFVDKMGDAALMPEGVPADKVKLLQQETVTGTVFTVVEAGKIKPEEVSAYFDKVKAALEADKSLSNLVIGDISANTMAYHFSQADENNQILLNERCIIMLHGESLYNTCASNPDMNQDELAEAVKYVAVVQ